MTRIDLCAIGSRGGVLAGAETIQPGDFVSVYVRRGALTSWRRALSAFGPVNVGDTLVVAFESETPTTGHPRKNFGFRLAYATDKESKFVELAIRTERENSAASTTVASTEPDDRTEPVVELADGSTSSDWGADDWADDTEPF